jgi:DNA-binding CsgD family transcriptional regulator
VPSKSKRPTRATPPRGLRASALDLGDTRFIVFSFPVEGSSGRDDPTAGWMSPLTAAEREVTALALEGLSTAEIAQLRGRSVATVNKQLEMSYRKLGVSSRAELAALSR